MRGGEGDVLYEVVASKIAVTLMDFKKEGDNNRCSINSGDKGGNKKDKRKPATLSPATFIFGLVNIKINSVKDAPRRHKFEWSAVNSLFKWLRRRN